jgi:2-polyprenyl-3-methyl-5-hydroxy-6-metoxy-1,4-benzoquinol methylase
VSIDDARELWDAEAATFDDETDHGLTDPVARDAWRTWLMRLLPEPPAEVLDLGCGTGSLSVLLALEGFRVSGIDLSERMLERARAKALAAGVDISFTQGDAGALELAPAQFDVLLDRHVLWAMEHAPAALTDWVRLVRPGGSIVLVEGFWSTGAGMRSDDCAQVLAGVADDVGVHPMPDPVFWGHELTDERYTVTATAR